MSFQPGQIPVGRVLGGGWRVLRPLGRSTPRSALFAVEQQSTGRTCALRVLDPELVAKSEGRERFSELCRARASVKSAHVVDLLDAGVDERTKAPWFAMPYLEGNTLAERVAKEPLSNEDAFDVLGQVAQALSAIHAAGMAYGRLDPSAVILVEGEQFGASMSARVLDFWTHAWLREEYGAKERASALLWMAPEHASEPATQAGDVWTYGLLAFFAFTGRAYWLAAADDDVIKRSAVEAEVQGGELVAASARAEALEVGGSLPDGFDAWFARCVDRDPEARFASVAAAGEALDALFEPDDGEDDAPEVPARPRAASKPRADGAPASPRAPDPAPAEGFMQRVSRSPDLYVPVLMVLLLGGALALRARVMRNRAQGLAAPTAAAAPGAAPAPSAPGAAPAAPPDQPTSTPSISAAAVTQLVTALGEGRGSPAWVTAMADDPFSIAQAEQLIAAFRRAGWDVKPLQRTSLRLRPGLFLFAADTSPPEYVQTLASALTTAGLNTAYRQGYREYAEEMRRTRPDFRGFLTEEGQSFVLVVGRGEVTAQ
ncbi:MAG: protein kinase [Polyangiales bacterium]